MKREHNIDDCLRILTRKDSITRKKVKNQFVNELVIDRHKSQPPGNKSWGRLDFLRRMGWIISFSCILLVIGCAETPLKPAGREIYSLSNGMAECEIVKVRHCEYIYVIGSQSPLVHYEGCKNKEHED